MIVGDLLTNNINLNKVIASPFIAYLKMKTPDWKL